MRTGLMLKPRDDLKTPALVWVGGCTVGEAAGSEVSAAILAAVTTGLLIGPLLGWYGVAGLVDGAILGLCQWAALRRLGDPPRFLGFALVTMAATAFAFSILHAAGAAWGEDIPRLGLSVGVYAATGALVAAAQAITLAKRGVRPLRWILAATLGWAAAGLLVGLTARMIGADVGVAALSGAAAGIAAGLFLGLCTLVALKDYRGA
jgi:hypothetical protein